jgi:probable HAF family extracellular repeat protein
MRFKRLEIVDGASHSAIAILRESQVLIAARLSRLSLLASGALLLGTAAGQTYSVEDLGPLSDLPSRTDSGPYGINLSGDVAAANVTNGSYHAMLYNGSWKDLGTLGGSESLAGGLNDSAQVVGYSQTSAGDTNAFLWTPGAATGVPGNPQMQNLGTLGGSVSQAYAINNSGQITGYSDVPSRPTVRQHVFVYSSGAMTDLGQQLGNLVNSFGYGINAAGHIAGTAYDSAYTAPHAFFFNGSTLTDLGLFGGLGSSVSAINNSDTIAGYLTTTSSLDHAFSYRAGAVTDLGTLGGHYSYALGLNNSNAIVGGSFADSKDSIYHAFVWQNGAMADLNGLLDSTGAGWTLVEARAVNDAGRITGIGQLGGINHVFRLSPLLTTNQAPKITSIQTSGANVILHFTTMASRTYAVLTNATLSSTGWGNLATNIVGNGGTVAVTNLSGISSLPKFYRVRLLP